MASRIVITGAAKLRRKLSAAGPLAQTALAAAVVEEQEKVMAKAKAITPVDTGTLRASGHVSPPKVGAGSVEVIAGFGGAASAYAVVQHERLDYAHPTGQAKFLEEPFLQAAPQIPRNLARGVEMALQRLRGG